MDNFIRKINFDFQTNQKSLNLISKIDLYKGKWDAIEKKENIYLKELKEIATLESIGSSTRIEGATISNEEIKELLNKIKITKLKTRDEQEVFGYYDTLELVFENFSNIDLTENTVKQFHQNLLKYSPKDQRHRGSYKSLSNKVVANYPDGLQKVIFNTTEVFLVANEMNQLLNITNESLLNKEIHPLLIIAHFVYEFLSIHPFQDENGRLSRLLTSYLLLKAEYHFIQYVSFENLIEKTKKEYYSALMHGQKNRYKDDEIISEWTLYFLNQLNLLTQKLDAKYDVFKSKGGYLSERQKKIQKFIEENQTVKFQDIAKAFQDITTYTLKKDLEYLRNEKMVSTIGKGKGTIYLKK